LYGLAFLQHDFSFFVVVVCVATGYDFAWCLPQACIKEGAHDNMIMNRKYNICFLAGNDSVFVYSVKNK